MTLPLHVLPKWESERQVFVSWTGLAKIYISEQLNKEWLEKEIYDTKKHKLILFFIEVLLS
jgi:hypothetical protein